MKFKKGLNPKSFVSGLMIGVFVTFSITVFGAANEQIEAWLTKDASIYIDGKQVFMDKDMYILNYKGRIYTPSRVVAEAMDGKVGWDDENKRVTIEKPKPIVVEKEVEIEKIVQKPAEIMYYKPPARHKVKDVIVNFIGWSKDSTRTYIYFDIENKYSRSIEIDYKNAYMEVEGKKYPIIEESNRLLGSSLKENEVLKDQQIIFEGFKEETTKVRIVMPIKLDEYTIEKGTQRVSYVIDAYVDFNDEFVE